MTDLGREISAAVRVDWSELREEVAWAGVRPRQRRRVVARVVLACAVAAAVVGTVKLRKHEVQAPVPPSEIVRTETVQTPIAVATQTQTPAPESLDSEPPPKIVELPRGTHRFEVDDKALSVRSGHITITAHNAVFACSRSKHATSVEVFRGSVYVHDGESTREILAGEHADFGEPAESAPTSADPVEDLLRMADVMRLSHDPAEALGPLRRVVSAHPGDRRAPLAAFTLGRVLLDQLSRPREAAAAFADAIRLAPEGPLVEDALARQIEALSRAGDTASARAYADAYLIKFPHGRKVRAVRTFGGVP